MRSRATKNQIKKSVLIIGEGTCEQVYFKQLNQTEKYKSIHIESKVPPHPMPTDIVNRAIKLKKESAFNSVWCILDIDKESQNPSDFNTAIKRAKEHRIKIAKISPCLELWFLLHFKKTTKPFISCEEVESDLIKYLPKYDKSEKFYRSTNIAQLLSPKLNKAIENSIELEKHNIKNQTNSSTSEFHKIIQDINSLL